MKIAETIILASGILNNQKGEILLVKRSKNNKAFKNFWQLPEGKIQPGEQPIETLARELSEEHTDYQWVSIEKAIKMSNLVDGTKEILLVLK